MIELFVSAGFGIVVISMAFLIVVFTRAYHAKGVINERRYKVVVAALALSSAGIGLWALNPLSQSLGGPPLHVAAMIVASVCVLTASAMLIGSTAMGGGRETLNWFLGCSTLWLALCLIWAYLYA